MYGAETERLLGICKFHVAECFARHFSVKRLVVASVHSSPDANSPVVAYVYAVLKLPGDQHGGLTVGLDVELAASPGQFVTWMETVGDWGYGIFVSGVRPRGQWVQIFGAPLPASAWLAVESASFPAIAESIEGMILGLEHVRATSRDGARKRIRSENYYMILRSSPKGVEFRSEVAIDMPCAEPVEKPPMMPPILRAPPAEFFNADGSPRFAVAYPKGC
jgi:hypothetical protein